MVDAHRMVARHLVQVPPVQRPLSSSFVSSNMKPVIQYPGGVFFAAARSAPGSARRGADRVDAVELLHAARMAVAVDEPGHDRHAGGVDDRVPAFSRFAMSAFDPTAKNRPPSRRTPAPAALLASIV